MYEELSAKLYDNQTLIIGVLPKYQAGSWLSLYHSRGIEWHLKDLGDPRARGFANLPHHRLKRVVVGIEAPQCIPRSENRGQMLCLYFKMRDVTKMLIEAKESGLHEVEVVFLDSKNGKWFEEEHQAPRTTIRRIRDIPLFRPETDYGVIRLALWPFTRVHKDTWLVYDYAAGMNKWLKTGMKRSETDPDGKEKPGAKKAFSPAITKRMEMLYAHYDLALDGEPGHTADMLRVHRFATWYSREMNHGSDYLRGLERMWKDPVWEDEWMENDSIAIEQRYFRAHALNPSYYRYDVVGLGGGNCSSSCLHGCVHRLVGFSNFLKDGSSAVKDTGGWNRDDWFRCYPNGVQPWGFTWEGWRKYLYAREARTYRDESDAFAKRFGGQASRFFIDYP